MNNSKKQLIYRSYIMQKRIRDLSCDGDKPHIATFRGGITIEDIEAMDRYIQTCEDIGLQYLRVIN